MDKAAIGQERDHAAHRQQGANLLQHRLIVLESHRRTLVLHRPPGQRDSPASIDERGPDQHERSERGGIQSHIEPLWMMQPAGKPLYPAGDGLRAALGHFRPGRQMHRPHETKAGDGPSQRVEPTAILVNRSGNEVVQSTQEFLMHLMGFGHGGTSLNLNAREDARVSCCRVV